VPSFSLPRPPLGDAVDLVPAVIGIFLICFADGILTVRSFAGKQYQHIRANQELLAFAGLSAATGVTQGFRSAQAGRARR
jgi:SulP family sulfate permease